MRPRPSTSASGLVAWLEETQIHLPLKAIECRFAVAGPAVDVQIDQIFYQSALRPLDVTYTFPLPSRGAVYRCEMIVNDRTIRAKVLEQQAARKVAAAKKAEGRRTALVEMERANVFTLSLGNAQPGDLIVIRLAYIEELEAWKDELSLQIPFAPGRRYIPGQPLLRSNLGKGTVDDTEQVPDASRISPPRIDRMHPDAATLSLSGTLDGRDVDWASISSPTHPTAVRPAGSNLQIFLPNDASFPDRDFILRWRRANRSDLLPIAHLFSDQKSAYALIQLRAPDDAPMEIREGNDVYFLVDRSGSMAGAKWMKTAEALVAFVTAAASKDRIWITFFESDFRDFAEKPIERDALLRDRNFQSIVEFGTDGGTELLPALRHLLGARQRFSLQRWSHIVLITDGQIGNEQAVLEEMAAHDVPVHSFGIDDAVNEAFLRQLSGQQRGAACFLTPNDDLVRPVAILASQFSKPVVTGLSLTGNWELAEAKLPDIYAGQVVFASIRVNEITSEITVTGKDASGRPLSIRLQSEPAQTDLPKLIWMKRRIDNLLQAGRRDEAIELAVQANLVCRGTAIVAWDETEKVTIAQDEVYQPSPQLACSPLPSAPFVGMTKAPRCDLSIDAGRLFARRIIAFTARRGSLKELGRLAQRAFDRADSRKLLAIVRDWAKQTNDQSTRIVLRNVLEKCRSEVDAEALRRILSEFLFSLPEPWHTKAASVLKAAAALSRSSERSWRSFLSSP